MREVAFIKQNKEKWLEFEEVIQKNLQKSPDEIAELHVKIMNDLSYAQTFYPKSKVTVYLNKLAKASFSSIYMSKQQEKNAFVHFFLYKVPLLCYEYRKYIYLAFAFFFITFIIGLISTFNDINFAEIILGHEYISETISNINNGDALAIYKGGSNWGAFIGIFENNFKVSLFMFLSGLFLGFGTGYFIIRNGIMVAVFQSLFIQYDSFWDSIKGIWIHGTYEIFSLIIVSACGYMIGGSLLFPGTLPRKQSFIKGMRDASYIFITTIPFLFVAAFLEGYVTRYYNSMPTVFCYLIILACLVSISYYYIIFPFSVKKKHSAIDV